MLSVAYLISIFKESSIVAIDAGFFCGLFYMVASEFFFTDSAAIQCGQFMRTLPAFALSFLLMVCIDGLFYGGFRPGSESMQRRMATLSRSGSRRMHGTCAEHLIGNDYYTETQGCWDILQWVSSPFSQRDSPAASM